MVDLPNLGAALDVDEPIAGDEDVAAAARVWTGLSARRIAFGVATVFALGTAAWAILSGESRPITVMLFYCMAASTLAVYVATAAPSSQPAPAPVTSEPTSVGTSEAWKLVETLTVSDASRLWCSVEPGAAATQETIAWGRALLDAVAREELPILPKPGAPKDAIDWERKNPHYQTQVTRASLKSWANEHGHFPAFLQD